ncbi:hypothetical protein KCV87_22740 [Actinosynnema pretiosum subsp. pretiosum]|uniref:Uncharacterized protein n=1 Tax=Actinosynnema pretiosum subsp. pretiosum TaxID=103721 RepID=A0AA45L2L4_9PSEU|nr:hypothetical protein KCV87_22740 [Actinosynnema pretiosum subsp. pretiosum]
MGGPFGRFGACGARPWSAAVDRPCSLQEHSPEELGATWRAPRSHVLARSPGNDLRRRLREWPLTGGGDPETAALVTVPSRAEDAPLVVLVACRTRARRRSGARGGTGRCGRLGSGGLLGEVRGGPGGRARWWWPAGWGPGPVGAGAVRVGAGRGQL